MLDDNFANCHAPRRGHLNNKVLNLFDLTYEMFISAFVDFESARWICTLHGHWIGFDCLQLHMLPMATNRFCDAAQVIDCLRGCFLSVSQLPFNVINITIDLSIPLQLKMMIMMTTVTHTLLRT